MIKLKQYSPSTESVATATYTVEFVAILVHQLNDTYRSLIGETPKGAWETLDEDVKQSTVKGIVYILQNPDVTPAEVHAKWVEERTCEGWSFGETMDPDAKTHPCLTPYEDLPLAHRMKDYLYCSTVKAVMAALDEDQRLTVSVECDCDGYSPGMWN